MSICMLRVMIHTWWRASRVWDTQRVRQRKCTSLLPKGDGRTKCGKPGQCTKVRKLDRDGNVQWSRYVCWSCRKRMRLPDRDVDFTADGSVFDHMTGNTAVDEAS